MLALIDVAKILLGTARGLRYLHGRKPVPIIHRDIKTENVLLSSDLSPKVCDLGEARSMAENKTMTSEYWRHLELHCMETNVPPRLKHTHLLIFPSLSLPTPPPPLSGWHQRIHGARGDEGRALRHSGGCLLVCSDGVLARRLADAIRQRSLGW